MVACAHCRKSIGACSWYGITKVVRPMIVLDRARVRTHAPAIKHRRRCSFSQLNSPSKTWHHASVAVPTEHLLLTLSCCHQYTPQCEYVWKGVSWVNVSESDCMHRKQGSRCISILLRFCSRSLVGENAPTIWDVDALSTETLSTFGSAQR